MAALLTFHDAETRMKLVMEFFGNDTNRFIIHLSNHLKNNLKCYQAHMAPKDKNEAKQGEEKESKPEKITTSLEKYSPPKVCPRNQKYFDTMRSAIEKDTNLDLCALLKTTGVNGSKLLEAQRFRRASALGALSSSISSGDGRKLSSLEKNLLIVEDAVKLATTEEAEDLELEDEWVQEEFNAGDAVTIIEGENCGLFGTLQHAIGGMFGAFDTGVREDDEGNYGVDVHVSDAIDEGFWIHPEAMQHKKYEASSEVKVIDGINTGRVGNIQSDEGRIRIDNGSYGVDVKMEDGSIEGYWIHPTSMIPANDIGKKENKEKEDENADLEEIDEFEFLPYIPFPGDSMDEALAEELNIFEIDINIKRLVAKNGKVIYRFGGKRQIVRYIHGVFLFKDGKTWSELMPILRKLAGKPAPPSF